MRSLTTATASSSSSTTTATIVAKPSTRTNEWLTDTIERGNGTNGGIVRVVRRYKWQASTKKREVGFQLVKLKL